MAEALARGADFHKAGQPAEALAWYQAALAMDPDDAEANSLLGLALVHAGRQIEGTSYLKRAVELEPDQAAFRFNLVQALRAARAYGAALAELGAVLARDPESVLAWERAGDIARQQADDDGAAKAWSRACELSPTAPEPAVKLADLHVAAGRFDAALAVLDPVAERAGEDERIYMLRCQAHAGLRDWPRLRRSARSWADGSPRSVEAWRHLAQANFEQGRQREAIDAFYRVLIRGAPNAGDLNTYAVLCRYALQFDAAEAALKRALALDPANASTLTNRAQISMYRGRFSDSESDARRAIGADPRHVPAYAVLSTLHAGALDDADLEAVSTMARDPEIALDRRISAAFVRAHALDAGGEVDTAFAAYRDAHELAMVRDRSERRAYDAVGEEVFEQSLVDQAAGAPSPSVASGGGPRPIFIVGMPRAGSTLVECVLGAHSRVFACGERASMREIVRAFRQMTAQGAVPDDQALNEWSRRYLDDLPALGGATHVTDKNPLNIESVGLIMRLLPHALVLHVRRDPLENCLSAYRQELSRLWTFAHRLQDIAHYYRRGERLAAHWERAFPGRFLTVQYEEFVRNFSTAAPALLDACGLTWEPQCLTFQSSSRPVTSLSAVQVRGPLIEGNERAARYAAHLAPLTAALAITDRPTGN